MTGRPILPLPNCIKPYRNPASISETPSIPWDHRGGTCCQIIFKTASAAFCLRYHLSNDCTSAAHLKNWPKHVWLGRKKFFILMCIIQNSSIRISPNCLCTCAGRKTHKPQQLPPQPCKFKWVILHFVKGHIQYGPACPLNSIWYLTTFQASLKVQTWYNGSLAY